MCRSSHEQRKRIDVGSDGDGDGDRALAIRRKKIETGFGSDAIFICSGGVEWSVRYPSIMKYLTVSVSPLVTSGGGVPGGPHRLHCVRQISYIHQQETRPTGGCHGDLDCSDGEARCRRHGEGGLALHARQMGGNGIIECQVDRERRETRGQAGPAAHVQGVIHTGVHGMA